jgi:hypothetical protein
MGESAPRAAVRDVTRTADGGVTREGTVRTSSSTGGPVWIKPASLAVPAPSGGATVQKARHVTTVMTAGGVLRTIAVDPSTASLTVGHSWTRLLAGWRDSSGERVSVGTVSEVTPIATPPLVHRFTTDPRTNRRDPPVTLVAPEAPDNRAIDAPEAVRIAAEVVVDHFEAARVAAEVATGRPETARTATEPPVTRGSMSARSRQQLSTFISTAVLPKANQVYEKEWAPFLTFVRTEMGSDDPFLTACTGDEKASLVALMMMRRHEAGKRGKAATAVTAAVRQMYARAMRSTDFFNSSIIATARTSCLMKPDELRAARDRGSVSMVKLPLCESLVAEMRLLLWVTGWADAGLGWKSLYMV